MKDSSLGVRKLTAAAEMEQAYRATDITESKIILETKFVLLKQGGNRPCYWCRFNWNFLRLLRTVDRAESPLLCCNLEGEMF